MATQLTEICLDLNLYNRFSDCRQGPRLNHSPKHNQEPKLSEDSASETAGGSSDNKGCGTEGIYRCSDED